MRSHLSASHDLRRRAHARPAAIPVITLALAFGCGHARAQVLDPTFAPAANDTVRAVALQPGGAIVIGGDFSHVSTQLRPHLARVSAQGTLLPAPAMPNDVVRSIAVRTDGRIVIGGDFGVVGGATHRYVARLLANGAVDSTFQSDIAYTAGVRVTSLALQPDGKVVVAGGFVSVSGQPRPGLARLNADGSNDASFDPPAFDANIDAMTLQPDGGIVLAGAFNDIDEDCEFYCVLRLTPGGAFDTAFGTVSVIGSVRTLVPQSDGRVLVGGNFGELGKHETYFVGRINAGGGVDTGFANTALRYSDIMRMAPLPDGGVVIAGEIRWGTAGQTRDRVARLLPGGARDPGFAEPELDSMIIGSVLQPDLQLILGGMFTQVSGQPRGRIVRMRVGEFPDPIFDSSFE